MKSQMKKIYKYVSFTPYTTPVYLFILVILSGTILLHLEISCNDIRISWVDALFTAVSATCVTGLSVVDTGSFFSLFGQGVVLGLIQLGGLGIVTYTCFIFYLAGRTVPLKDRISVTSALMQDSSMNFRRFIFKVILFTVLIESVGALMLHLYKPGTFTVFYAVFHSISAFCNAGFSLFPDSLFKFQGDIYINFIFMFLIITGGLGFAVLTELYSFLSTRLLFKKKKKNLSWYSKLVIKTSFFLIFAGFIIIFTTEYFSGLTTASKSLKTLLTGALFQSVTSRTAGFNTMNIGLMSNESLFIIVILMYIGGASGSCAGGIKVGSLRIIAAFIKSNLRGDKQAVIDKYAIDFETLNKAIILVVSSFLFIMISVLILNSTECRNLGLEAARKTSFDIFFEAVSAFGTAGLSTGITGHLSTPGKIIISLLMFVGRIGPVGIISAIQSYQHKRLYKKPEESMLVG